MTDDTTPSTVAINWATTPDSLMAIVDHLGQLVITAVRERMLELERQRNSLTDEERTRRMVVAARGMRPGR